MNRFYRKVAEQVVANVSLEPLRDQSVLVTGANGLLGSHFLSVIAHANQTLGLDAKVLCTSRGTPRPWLEESLQTGGFDFVQADLANEPLPDFGRSFGCIIHAATYGQPRKFVEDPLSTMRLNSSVTAGLLELATKGRLSGNAPAKFLYLSSAEIYGNPPASALPTPESYAGNVSPLDGRAPYTSSKRFSETLCKIFSDRGEVDTRIARIASVFGPGTHLQDERVLNEFIRRALQLKVIKMLDAGLQKRRWLYISDAMIFLFHMLLHGKELVYNVGGTDFRSVAEMAQYIAEETGAEVESPPTDLAGSHNQGALSVTDLDISRILKETGLSKLVSLKEGIGTCVDWTKEQLKG